MPQAWVQDPSDRLDYVFDFAALTNETGDSDWLDEGETIASHDVIAESGINVDDSEVIRNDTAVLAWLNGGVVRSRAYRVTAEITTSAGRTAQRSISVSVAQR